MKKARPQILVRTAEIPEDVKKDICCAIARFETPSMNIVVVDVNFQNVGQLEEL